MARLVVALVVLGLATAFGLPSISELSYNPATANTGSLLPVLNSDRAKYSLGYHRIWVPTNIMTFDVEVVSVGTASCSITAFASARQFSCGNEWSAESGVTYPCQNVDVLSVYTTSNTRTYFPSSSYTESTFFQLGSWFYVAVGRYLPGSEFDKTCLYTVKVTATFCPEGQVASTGTGTTSMCYTPNTISSLPVTANVPVSGWTIHRFWLDSARDFTYWINSTTDFYVYAYSLTAPSDDIYLITDTGSFSDGGYLASGTVPAEKGWLWFALSQWGSSAGTADVMFDAPACPQGYTGEGCMFPFMNVTGVALNSMAAGVNPAPTSVEQWSYYAVTFANGTDGTYNFTVAPVTGQTATVYIYYRRNGFPVDLPTVYVSSNNWESITTSAETFSLQWQSLYAGGDFWFGLESGNTAAVNFTLSSTTAVSSTTAQTTDATTTGSSGAGNVVASFALVAFLLALFF